MKKLPRVQSDPGIIASACNLRHFSIVRRRLHAEVKQEERPATAMADLMDNLKGANGHWKQLRAREEWDHQMRLKEEYDRKMKIKEERQRKRHAEFLEKQKKIQEEELRRKLEEEERQRILEEEKLAKIRAQQEKEKQRKLREQKLWELKQPRTCEMCAGSGECPRCGGRGYFDAVYLSKAVQPEGLRGQFYGRTRRGCGECGGFKEDEDHGRDDKPPQLPSEPVSGNGLCANCKGTGKTKLSSAEIKRQMDEYDEAQNPRLRRLKTDSSDHHSNSALFVDTTTTAPAATPRETSKS